MSYRVKEIFYSIQGEGANAGRPAVFLRFAFCNMWSGLEKDRGKGGSCSAWCDTDFLGGDVYEGATALGDAASALAAGGLCVVTGGEPALQLDRALVLELRARGFEVAVETNGTKSLPCEVMWTTVSPKAGAKLVVRRGDEIKLVYPQNGLEPETLARLDFRHFFLQPKDGPDLESNTRTAIAYCLEHPQWRLSVQTQKVLGIR